MMNIERNGERVKPASPKHTVTARRRDGTEFTTKGRDAWALCELVKAGPRGCTPIDHPGPRWASYVHKLRRKHGLDIATIDEAHDGPYPGRHARYVLRDAVQIVAIDGVAQREAA